MQEGKQSPGGAQSHSGTKGGTPQGSLNAAKAVAAEEPPVTVEVPAKGGPVRPGELILPLPPRPPELPGSNYLKGGGKGGIYPETPQCL